MKNILILGGGYGGVLTAKKLAKQIKKGKIKEEVSVSVIDRNPFNTMLTELHEVAANRVDEESIKMDFRKIFAGRNIHFNHDEIEQIDYENNILKGEKASYRYDYLVLGSGSSPNYFGVPGAEKFTHSFWSFDDAVNLKRHILACFRRSQKTRNPVERARLLTFVVVGSGLTGIEMMGELAEWSQELCENYYVEKHELKLILVDMMDRIIPTLPKKLYSLRAKARRHLEKMGVEIRLQTKVVEVKERALLLESAGRTDSFVTQSVIWTSGTQGSEIIRSSEEPKDGKVTNRVQTDEFLRHKEHPNVYVVGDNILFVPEGETLPVPQMVENAEASAHTVAHNLISSLSEKGEKEAYQPKFHGAMVCVGSRFGVAYVGTHKHKIALPSFLAMFSKHFINLVYFVQVLGWNKVYDYLLHEIFRAKKNRSFVGGYFSNNIPSFYLVPLRLYLAYEWIIKQGIPKFQKVLAHPNDIFLFSIPEVDSMASATATEEVVVEAVAGATDVATGAADAVSIYGEALPVPEWISTIVDWTMATLVAPIAPQFQALIISLEIIFGLCILGGFFTAMAAIGSLILCLMIWSSGMAAESILWYMVASIALIGIGGTGHTFSLDYYVLPWLKRRWKKIPFIRKWYLYNE